jgi:CRISPR/Cas system CMR subunit Cmr4 (Cas7 group RAMP superfamily)
MNAKEAMSLTPQEKSDLESKINKWYGTETQKAKSLLSTFKKSPLYDDVRLLVTEFKEILPMSNKRKTPFLTKHKLEVNDHIVKVDKDNSIYDLLGFKTGVARVVRLTIADRQKKKGESTAPLNHYIPAGTVFIPKNSKSNVLAGVARRDFKQVEGFCFGKELYFVFSAKFNPKDLTKYAVLIQRLEDGQVGLIDPGVHHDL